MKLTRSRVKRCETAAFCLGIALGLCPPSHAAPPAPQPMDEQQLRQQIMEMMGKGAAVQSRSPDEIEVVVRTGHAATITAVAISPDGRLVASGGMDQVVKLWDVASSQEVRSMAGQGLLWPSAIAFSPDSARLAVADADALRLLDAASGAELARVPAAGVPFLISANGRRAAGEVRVDGRPQLEVVEIATGQVAWAEAAQTGTRITALSPDGRLFATLTPTRRQPGSDEATEESVVEVWAIDERRRVAQSRLRLPSSVIRAYSAASALSPDGRWLVAEDGRGNLQVFDPAKGEAVRSLQGNGLSASSTSTTLAFSADGRSVVWSTSGGQSRLWSMPDGQPRAELTASAVSWSADGRMLVLGHGDGGAPVLRDQTTGAETPLEAGAAEVSEVSLAANGRAVLAAMRDGSARWWDLATGQVVRSFRCPGGGAASSAAASRAQAIVALGCADGSASLWNATSAERTALLLEPIAGEQVPVIVRFAPDGRTLLAARRTEVIVFDTAAARELRRIQVPVANADPREPPQAQWIRALAVSPAEPVIAVGQHSALGLWNFATGAQLKQFTAAGVPLPPMAGGARVPPLPGGGALPQLPPGALGRMPAMPPNAMNPFAMLNATLGSAGAHSAVFSPDGRRLLTGSLRGHQLWDVNSGQEIQAPPSPGAGGVAAMPDFINRLMEGAAGVAPGSGQGVAFGPDGRVAARGVGKLIKLWEPSSGRALAELRGHTSDVVTMAFSEDGSLLVSGGRDGAIRLWRLPEGREMAALIAIGARDFFTVAPDQYYRASKSRLQGVSFRVHGELYPFEQFDLRFNRPDIILERIGLAPADLVASYRHAYERRLKKMGFNEASLGRDFHLPQIELAGGPVPVTTDHLTLTLKARASDSQYPLDRFAAYVNDVPVFGAAGVKIAGQVSSAESEITVPLVAGRNKVQVAVLNSQGVESLRRTAYTNAVADPPAADVWVVAIGVSHYANPRYDLRFAAKDASDIASAFAERKSAPGAPLQVHVLAVTDSKATRDGIRAARAWLQQARPQDLVVVFAAGHGMTDADQNYYFGTFDIDPAAPAARGLPFEDFENLLDGIAPLRKLLLVDTCFSGEIDRDDPAPVTTAASSGRVTMRTFKAWRGISVQADDSGAPPAFARFQQDLFADLRRGTGAAVISSASGNEFALEGDQWGNGVFTYAVLDGLKNGKADRNGDGVVTVGELEAYVIAAVRNLTEGKQNPTIRRENLDFDFGVYPVAPGDSSSR